MCGFWKESLKRQVNLVWRLAKHQNKLASFKKGIQYVGWQTVEMINKTILISFFLVKTRNWLQARLTVYPPQCADQNPVNLSKIIFSALKLLHVHLQYVCDIPTMH